jgi:hypothetical protein
MDSLDGDRTIFSYIPILQQVNSNKNFEYF